MSATVSSLLPARSRSDHPLDDEARVFILQGMFPPPAQFAAPEASAPQPQQPQEGTQTPQPGLLRSLWDEPTRFLESLHSQLVFDFEYKSSSITDSWLPIARTVNPNFDMSNLVVSLLRGASLSLSRPLSWPLSLVRVDTDDDGSKHAACMSFYTSGKVLAHEVPLSTFGMALSIVRNNQMSEMGQVIACRKFEQLSGHPLSALFDDVSLWSKAVHEYDRENAETVIFQNAFKLIHHLNKPQTFCDGAVFRWVRRDGRIVFARVTFIFPDELNFFLSENLHIYGCCGFTTFFDSPPSPV